MLSTLTYNGYTTSIEIDEADGILIGRLIGIADIVTFHAEDVAGFKAAFHEAVDDYVALNAEAAQKPYSGNLMFRVGPDLHAAAMRAAKAADMSLARWGTMIIAAAAKAGDAGTTVQDQSAPAAGEPVSERVTYDDREIVRLASGTIQVRRGGVVQPVVVKEALKPIAAEIGVDKLNAKGKLKNTRTLGDAVIKTLMKQRAYMCRLVGELGLEDRERIYRAYEKAEADGLLARRSNVRDLPAYEYARRLLADGERKGWLR